MGVVVCVCVCVCVWRCLWLIIVKNIVLNWCSRWNKETFPLLFCTIMDNKDEFDLIWFDLKHVTENRSSHTRVYINVEKISRTWKINVYVYKRVYPARVFRPPVMIFSKFVRLNVHIILCLVPTKRVHVNLLCALKSAPLLLKLTLTRETRQVCLDSCDQV